MRTCCISNAASICVAYITYTVNHVTLVSRFLKWVEMLVLWWMVSISGYES